MATIDSTIVEAAVQLCAEKGATSVVKGVPTTTVSKTDVSKFMNEFGITKAIAQRYEEVVTALDAGLAKHNTNTMIDAVAAAKKEGTDPKEVVATTVAHVGNEQHKISGTAYTKRMVPTQPGVAGSERREVTKYNEQKLTVRRKLTVDADLLDASAKAMEAALK